MGERVARSSTAGGGVTMIVHSGEDGTGGAVGAGGGQLGAGPDAAPVLLISTDAGLALRVERLARTVDVAVVTVPAWPPQPVAGSLRLVLVGADVAADVGVDVATHDAARVARDPSTDRVAAHRPVQVGDAPGVPLRGVPIVLVAAHAVASELWRAAVSLGAEQLVVLPEAETWLVSRLLDADGPPPPRAHVIGVTGGRGGAGASVLAAGLARTAVMLGRRCVLLDADPLGGGSDLLLGAEGEPGLRWPDLAAARGRLQPHQLMEGLPVIDGVAVISWDRRQPGQVPPEAMRAVLDAATRVADLVVVDIPRALDTTAVAALDTCHLALLVVPAEVRASVSASRSAALLRRRVADVRVVVRGPAPTGLASSSIAGALDLPLAGWLRPERGLAAALDRGEPPALRPRGPLASFCRHVLAESPPPPITSAGGRDGRRASARSARSRVRGDRT